MFIKHIKSNVQSVMTHTAYLQKPKKLSRRVLLGRGNY